MQQHMLAEIDEQIAACRDALRMLTESEFECIGSNINGNDSDSNEQHVVLGSWCTDPKKVVDLTLDKYKKMGGNEYFFIKKVTI
jgi:hypothetical protein